MTLCEIRTNDRKYDSQNMLTTYSTHQFLGNQITSHLWQMFRCYYMSTNAVPKVKKIW